MLFGRVAVIEAEAASIGVAAKNSSVIGLQLPPNLRRLL